MKQHHMFILIRPGATASLAGSGLALFGRLAADDRPVCAASLQVLEPPLRQVTLSLPENLIPSLVRFKNLPYIPRRATRSSDTRRLLARPSYPL